MLALTAPRPFRLLTQSLREGELQLRLDLAELLPVDVLWDMDDVDIVGLQGGLALELPPEILILDNVIEHRGTFYYYQRFRLTVDHESI